MRASLEGRAALVTGGGTGIGRATARELARRGAYVFVCGRRMAPLEQTVTAIGEDGGNADAIPCDVSDEAAVDRLIEACVKRASRLDILVNNAFQLVAGPLTTMSMEDWRRSFRVALDAAFLTMRRALPVLGQNGCGAVVNISSTAAHGGQHSLGAYGAAKAALENLSRTAAVEAAPFRVRVNIVAPGVIATSGTLEAFSDPPVRRAMERMIPLGRFGYPDEIAEAVAFLAGDEASFITGATLVVDGGQRASLGAPALEEGFEAG